jgi:hypothetical protein
VRVEVPTKAGCTVRVSSKNIAQVERVGGEKGLRQACLILSGSAARTISEGKITLKIGGEEYGLIKSKGGCIWAAHQTAETMDSYQKLFTKLQKTPDKDLSCE